MTFMIELADTQKPCPFLTAIANAFIANSNSPKTSGLTNSCHLSLAARDNFTFIISNHMILQFTGIKSPFTVMNALKIAARNSLTTAALLNPSETLYHCIYCEALLGID
jgi:hypothetical protein